MESDERDAMSIPDVFLVADMQVGKPHPYPRSDHIHFIAAFRSLVYLVEYTSNLTTHYISYQKNKKEQNSSYFIFRNFS